MQSRGLLATFYFVSVPRLFAKDTSSKKFRDCTEIRVAYGRTDVGLFPYFFLPSFSGRANSTNVKLSPQRIAGAITSNFEMESLPRRFGKRAGLFRSDVCQGHVPTFIFCTLSTEKMCLSAVFSKEVAGCQRKKSKQLTFIHSFPLSL